MRWLLAACVAVVTAIGAGALLSGHKPLTTGERLVAEANSVVGAPYVWGGNSPSSGFDCSGFVEWLLKRLGLVAPSFSVTADDLYRKHTRPIPASEVKAGDLAFYGTPDRVHHVMLVVGDGKNLVGASGGDRSTTSPAIAAQQGAAVKYRPISSERGILSFGRLPMVNA